MFQACLTLAQNPNEAQLLAESLEALARALRDWPADAWRKVNPNPTGTALFERLLARTQPAALDATRRVQALESAEVVAEVLRAMWPEARGVTASARDLALATR